MINQKIISECTENFDQKLCPSQKSGGSSVETAEFFQIKESNSNSTQLPSMKTADGGKSLLH